MKNFYLVAVTTLFLAACDGGSNGGSGGETPAPDTTSPVVTAPSSATFAAVDATGTPATSDAIATYLLGASATDDVDGTVSVTSDAPDIFSLGDTTVTFSASDAAGNSATAPGSICRIKLKHPRAFQIRPKDQSPKTIGSVSSSRTGPRCYKSVNHTDPLSLAHTRSQGFHIT